MQRMTSITYFVIIKGGYMLRGSTKKKPAPKKTKQKRDAKKLVNNKRFISNLDDLGTVVDSLKLLGNEIVLTQGVFDLLHEGHARYLEMAKKEGDLLIVGVDSDELTRQRKGDGRPIVPEKERIEMLLHLRHVDYVVLRSDKDEIGDLIRTVEPDTLITSSSTNDFTAKLIKEYRPYCGKIVTLPAQSTTSTSARVRQLTLDGARSLSVEINKLLEEFNEKISRI